jgi:DNA polymerase-3 subunit epsilon
MIIIVFDTETTGLPQGWNTPPTESDKYPHIVQLSYLLYDTELDKTLACEDHIIKLKSSVTLPPESVRIHGITRARMKRKGITIKQALDDFKMAMSNADIVVGHNVRFDKNMMLAEAHRNNRTIAFDKKGEYCTMLRSVDVCKLKKEGKAHFKYPRLSEIYYHLFGEMPQGVHDSMADVIYTTRCFLALHNQRVVTCKRLKRLQNSYKR